jgi:hypothetical protein
VIQSLRTNRTLWVLTALLALGAAVVGVFKPGIYGKVVGMALMPGVLGQDLTTVVASVAILALAIRVKAGDWKKQMVVLGILGYLFYAYGVYVIERMYSVLYYLYLAVFGLAFWSMVYGVAKIRPEILQDVQVPGSVRNVSAGFSLLVAVAFSVLWVIDLLPLVQAGEKIEFLYAVYVLDLCFIMPAFVIVGVMALRKAGLGLLLIPPMFVLGFAVMLSLAVSEMAKPLYDLAVTVGGLGPPLVLSLAFMVLAALHLRKLELGSEFETDVAG